MGVSLADAYINIIPSAKQVGSFMSGFGKRLPAQGKQMQNSFASGFGKGLTGVLSLVAVGAIAGAVKSVSNLADTFSELEDATGAASVVFGDSMGIIVKQSENAAATMGMTKAQVIDAANTFGTFGKAAGLTGVDLANFSTQMTTLAGDLSSFKGGSPEEAIFAIGAALRGESEPIRRYGVLLDDATLRQRALKMGLISTTKEALTPQQKTLAAQAEILAQTKDATGDFQRTQDSTANVAKRFDATLGNLQATIGQAVAPAFTLFRTVATGLFESFDAFLVGSMPAIEAFWGNLTAKIAPASEAVKGFFTAMASDSAGSGAFAQISQSVMGFAQTVNEQMTPAIQQFKDAVLPAFNQVLAATGGLFRDIQTALGPIISTLIDEFGPILAEYYAKLLPAFGQALAAVGSVITYLINSRIRPFVRLLGQVLPPVIRFLAPIVRTAFNAIRNVISGVLSVVSGIIKVFISVFKGDWRGAFNGVQSITRGGASIIKGIFQAMQGGVVGIVRALAGKLISAGAAAIRGLAGGIRGGVGAALGAARGVINSVVAAFAGMGGRLFSSGAAMIRGLARGIRSGFGAAISAAKSGLSKLRSFFPFSPAKEGPFSGRGYVTYSGLALTRDFANSILGGVDQTRAAARKLVEAAKLDVPGVPSMSGLVGNTPYPIGEQVTNISIDSVNLPDIEDVEEFIEWLKSLPRLSQQGALV